LAQQKAMEAKKAAQGSKSNSQYDDLLNQLYEQSHQADSFNSLNRQMGSQARGGQRRVA
jgi:hypothetical protein